MAIPTSEQNQLFIQFTKAQNCTCGVFFGITLHEGRESVLTLYMDGHIVIQGIKDAIIEALVERFGSTIKEHGSFKYVKPTDTDQSNS